MCVSACACEIYSLFEFTVRPFEPFYFVTTVVRNEMCVFYTDFRLYTAITSTVGSNLAKNANILVSSSSVINFH